MRAGVRKGTSALMILALLAVSSLCSGCLWLAIPSLAYQGYKYESGDQNGPAKQHQSTQAPSNDAVE